MFYIESYVECPLCRGKASKKTIARVGRCNNCSAEMSLLNLLKHENLTKKHQVNWKVNLISAFSKFVESSDYSKVFNYRIVLDFQKIIISISNELEKYILESWLSDIYYELSSYKSPIYLDIIKVFLFSKGFLKFDINNYPWCVTILDNWYYYNDDILEYYFDFDKCRDCGITHNDRFHNFCSTCSARRSLKKLCAKSNLKKKFNNIKTETFFLEFVNFMLKSQLQFRTVQDVSKLLVHVFILIEERINFPLGKKIISLDKNFFQEIINTEWIYSTFESYSEQSMTKDELRVLPAAYSHFCAFVKSKYIISPNEVLPHLKIENKRVVMVALEGNEREKIEERINNYPIGFHKLFNEYLEMKSKQIYVLEKKNAVKTLKWKSVSTLFGTFFRFIDWLRAAYHVADWIEISEEMVYSYLLTYEKQQNREIIKRRLFNLFEFGRKSKLLLANPIPPFKARSYDINKENFTLKDHALLNRNLKMSSLNNPTDTLLVSLCYFHVLTSKQIRNIKLSDIDLNRRSISIEGRPPAYLDDFEISILKNHLKITQYEREFLQISYLFFVVISNSPNKVSKRWVLKHSKKISGYSPSFLRRVSLQYCAAMFGPEYLHDCLGISQTHAARFGNPDDWIIEDIIYDEIKSINNKEIL